MSRLPIPSVRRVLETGVYVTDLARARDFYVRVFGFAVMLESPRLVALDVAGQSVLLLFARGESEEALDTPRGTIPGHGASGVQHFAFAIDADRLPAWEAHLRELGIETESRVGWSHGSQSVYFRDPDGHSVELATPGLWANY